MVDHVSCDGAQRRTFETAGCVGGFNRQQDKSQHSLTRCVSLDISFLLRTTVARVSPRDAEAVRDLCHADVFGTASPSDFRIGKGEADQRPAVGADVLN